MNELKRPSQKDPPGDHSDEQRVSKLLQEAGKRPELPISDLAIIRAAAHNEWRQIQEDRNNHGLSRGVRRFLALAAVLLLAVLTGWWWQRSGEPTLAATVATIEVSSDQSSGFEAGRMLVAGSSLSTVSPMAIRLVGGESVRLAAETSVQLVGASRLRLDGGAVYVDSGPEVAGDGLRIRTSHGVVREIGTQFEVRVGNGDEPLRVRVREGEVLVETGGESRSAAADEELTLLSDGSVRRNPLDPFGGAWNWMLEVAPTFSMEDSSLTAYLGWIERETGYRIEFADDELEASVDRIELSGRQDSLEGLAPVETLDVVLPASRLAYRLDTSTLRILRN